MINILDKYKVVRIDSLNYSYSVHREVKSRRTKQTTYKWVDSKKYYTTIEGVLKAIKEEILGSLFDSSNYTQETFLNAVEELQEALSKVNVELKE